MYPGSLTGLPFDSNGCIMPSGVKIYTSLHKWSTVRHSPCFSRTHRRHCSADSNPCPCTAFIGSGLLSFQTLAAFGNLCTFNTTLITKDEWQIVLAMQIIALLKLQLFKLNLLSCPLVRSWNYLNYYKNIVNTCIDKLYQGTNQFIFAKLMSEFQGRPGWRCSPPVRSEFWRLSADQD